MQDAIFLKYKELKQRIEDCREDSIITQADFNQLNKEMSIIFPYVNYYALYEIKINFKLLDNKLDIIAQKLKACIKKNRF